MNEWMNEEIVAYGDLYTYTCFVGPDEFHEKNGSTLISQYRVDDIYISQIYRAPI